MATDGQRDFDFLMGSWKVRNRRLKRILQGSDEWYEFEATNVAQPIWGGLANVDEFDGQMPSGRMQGMTVRLYDPKTHQWRLYWANAARGVLDEPVIGRFENGRGEFFNDEIFEGKNIRVRYIWSKITPTSCQWEQAFSPDEGKTWETNWVMEFTRA
jgi:hypothetical protein